MSNIEQFGRVCTLLVSNRSGAAIDLSKLRIKFSIKRSGVMTPNVADIRVYNLDLETAAIIKKEFTQVILQAGYTGNYGVIFQGNVKQVILGRESAVDTFIDIMAGDGDQAYNFSIVNTTIAAGSSQADHLNAAFTAMETKGVGRGFVGSLPGNKLPRGKVMYGNARDYIRGIAESAGFNWSIQDQSIQFVKQTAYAPGEAVVLTTKTGMIGTPQQTIEGINVKCLLNPKIKVHGRFKIDNASVEQFKLNFLVPGSAANTPVPLTNDGVYYTWVAEHAGDTRGLEWYTSISGLAIDISTNPLNSNTLGLG